LREQFERRVSEILARPLADLQSRGWLPPALGGFTSMPISREAHAGRMREVLERDRALAEANPEIARAEPTPPFEIALTPIAERSAPVLSNVQVTAETSATHRAPVEEVVVTEDEPVEPPSSPKRKSTSPCSEPIRTRTMAKLLLSQGHPARALSIYEFLIAGGASDPVLLAEADALRSLQT
jgi:hypothetical protein